MQPLVVVVAVQLGTRELKQEQGGRVAWHEGVEEMSEGKVEVIVVTGLVGVGRTALLGHLIDTIPER